MKITKGDITIEVNTETELKLVLDTLSGQQSSRKALNKSESELDATDVFARVYETIPTYGKAHKILIALKEKPEGMTDTELKEMLGLESSQALGGAMAGIGRRANAAGTDINHIVESTVTPNGGWLFKLTEEMRKVMENEKE